MSGTATKLGTALFGYYVLQGFRRSGKAFDHPVTFVDPDRNEPFDLDRPPGDVDERLSKAKKIVVPVHGYQPKSWFWARVWDEGQTMPYGNYDGVAYCNEVTAAVRQEADGELGEDVTFLYPIWPSNELWYVPTVRNQTAVTGRKLGEHLAEIQARAPDAEIELIAHSAGGAVTKYALETLAEQPSAKLGNVRQTLLDADVPASSLTSDAFADVTKRLSATRVVHDPNDRALLVAETIYDRRPFEKYYDPGNADASPTNLPDAFVEDLRAGNVPKQVLGRSGPTGSPPGTVETTQVNLPGVLKHTGHADFGRLGSGSQQAMMRLFGSITEPFS